MSSVEQGEGHTLLHGLVGQRDALLFFDLLTSAKPADTGTQFVAPSLLFSSSRSFPPLQALDGLSMWCACAVDKGVDG
jgi:hypothetical protein